MAEDGLGSISGLLGHSHFLLSLVRTRLAKPSEIGQLSFICRMDFGRLLSLFSYFHSCQRRSVFSEEQRSYTHRNFGLAIVSFALGAYCAPNFIRA